MKTVGYAWLIAQYRLTVLEPSEISSIHDKSSKQSVEQDGRREIYYPKTYDPGDEWAGNLLFALKHEGLNLEVMSALLPKLAFSDVEALVRALPLGRYARLVWYFYELFCDRKLGIEDLVHGNYMPILDEEQEFALPVQKAPRAKRQRLIVNLLGDTSYCPRIRKTKPILEFSAANVTAVVQSIVTSYPEGLVERASRYMYIKETKSSFEIEREKPDGQRIGKFVELLKRAGRTETHEERHLTALQNVIVEPRYAASGYRTSQNYIGESVSPAHELVHYIPPKPEDLGMLMAGWANSCRQIKTSGMEGLVLATVAGFGFVFLHPFDDGNGRIHRFLIHDALTSTGFTPAGMIFPISAVMLRRIKEYDAALEAFSRPCMEHIQYALDEYGGMSVVGDTGTFYRYPDLTAQAEALASFIQETALIEFTSELEYLALFDNALVAVRSILDMPDRKLELFVRLCIQGKGKLSAAKRGLFAEITDEELVRLENAVYGVTSK